MAVNTEQLGNPFPTIPLRPHGSTVPPTKSRKSTLQSHLDCVNLSRQSVATGCSLPTSVPVASCSFHAPPRVKRHLSILVSPQSRLVLAAHVRLKILENGSDQETTVEVEKLALHAPVGVAQRLRTLNHASDFLVFTEGSLAICRFGSPCIGNLAQKYVLSGIASSTKSWGIMVTGLRPT